MRSLACLPWGGKESTGSPALSVLGTASGVRGGRCCQGWCEDEESA